MTQTIIIVLFLASVGGLLAAEARGSSLMRWIFKPAASTLFIAYAVSCGALETAFGVAILAGLALCALGDVLLIPKGERTFLAGMAAFAAGHAAYIAAFYKAGVTFTPMVGFSAIVMAIFGALVLRWLWPYLAAFKGPVAGYSVIIGIMVVTSVAALASALAGSSPGIDGWRLAGGAIAFAVSDVSVAKDQFIGRRFANRLWGLPLYYGAQMILASSV